MVLDACCSCCRRKKKRTSGRDKDNKNKTNRNKKTPLAAKKDDKNTDPSKKPVTKKDGPTTLALGGAGPIRNSTTGSASADKRKTSDELNAKQKPSEPRRASAEPHASHAGGPSAKATTAITSPPSIPPVTISSITPAAAAAEAAKKEAAAAVVVVVETKTLPAPLPTPTRKTSVVGTDLATLPPVKSTAISRKSSRKSFTSATAPEAVRLSVAPPTGTDATSPGVEVNGEPVADLSSKSKTHGIVDGAKSAGSKVRSAAGSAVRLSHVDQAMSKVVHATHADKAASKVRSMTHVDQAASATKSAIKTQVVERVHRKKSTTKTDDGVTKTSDEEETEETRMTTRSINIETDDDDGEDEAEDKTVPKTKLKRIQSNMSDYGDVVVDKVTDNPVSNAIDKFLVILKVKKPKQDLEKRRAQRRKRRRRKRRRQTKAAESTDTDVNAASSRRVRIWRKITKRQPKKSSTADAEGDDKPATLKRKLSRVTQSVTNIGPIAKLTKRGQSKSKPPEKETDEETNKTVVAVGEDGEKIVTEVKDETSISAKLKNRRQTTFSKITGAPGATLAVSKKASGAVLRRGKGKPGQETENENGESKPTDDETPDDAKNATSAEADKLKPKQWQKVGKSFESIVRTPSRLIRKKQTALTVTSEDASGVETTTMITTDEDDSTNAKKPAEKKRGRNFLAPATSRLRRGRSKTKPDDAAGASADEETAADKPRSSKGARMSNMSTSTRPKDAKTADDEDLKKKTVKSRAFSLRRNVAGKGNKIANAAKDLPGKQVDRIKGNKKPVDETDDIIKEAQTTLIVDKVGGDGAAVTSEQVVTKTTKKTKKRTTKDDDSSAAGT